MKSTCLVLSILIIGLFSMQAQDPIQTIKSHYQYVNENLRSFKVEDSETFEESTDGATIRKYFDNGDCVKIRIEYYGETGKLFREYYLKDSELYFVFDQNFRYNMPYYMDSARAAQSGFDYWFDAEKTKLEESRFYFSNKKLIRWIEPGGKFLSKDSPEWRENEKYYLEDLQQLL